MDEKQILDRIHAMINDEHLLRANLAGGRLTSAEEQERLRAIEVELDRCWDLLRQRRALRDAGEDIQAARLRPPGEVEGYQQ